MNEWLPRALTNQDSISLFLFFNLLILLNLQRTIPNGLADLFRKTIRNTNFMTPYHLPYFHFLHVGSFLVGVSGFSLWILTFVELVYPKVAFPNSALYSLFGLLIALLSARAFLIQFILQNLNVWKEKRGFYFHSLATQFIIGFLLLIALTFYYYSFPTRSFFGISSGLVLAFWLFLHIRFLLQYLIAYQQEIIYLIFYLCCLKLAPWLWMYKQFL